MIALHHAIQISSLQKCTGRAGLYQDEETHTITEMEYTHSHSQFKLQHRPVPLCKV